MGEIVKLNSGSPLSWTVTDALDKALLKVKSGEFMADKVYVALCRSAQDGHGPEINYLVAGMQVPEVLGWLHLHMDFLTEES